MAVAEADYIHEDSKQIFYKKSNWKYQLTGDVYYNTPLRPELTIITDYIHLYPNGLLLVKKGYAWDGLSGPTFDTKDSMRGGLLHDASYQLMRMKLLDRISQEIVDEFFRKVLKEDGMGSFRAAYIFKGVELFGASSTDPLNVKKIYSAP